MRVRVRGYQRERGDAFVLHAAGTLEVERRERRAAAGQGLDGRAGHLGAEVRVRGWG